MKNKNERLSSYREIEQLLYRTDHLFNRLMLNPTTKTHTVSEIEAVVEMLIHFTRTTPDEMIGITHLRTDIKYSVIRAVQNTVFALLVSDEMEWLDEERTRSLCCAALTEHISLYPLRDHLNQQDGGLTPWQSKMIESFPQKAVKLLLSIGVTDQRWIHTVGTFGAHGNDESKVEEVSSEITILSIVTRYGAMVTARGPRKPMTTEQTIQALLNSNATDIEEKVVTALLYSVGFYPPGSAVKLQNGEIAIVTHRSSRGHPLRIASICDANGELFKTPQPRNTLRDQNQISHSLQLDWTQHLNTALLWDPSDSKPAGKLLQTHTSPMDSAL